MKLREIEFGPILDAAGARGFFGGEYWHQKLLGPFGPNAKGCTFVSKTVVFNGRVGNMFMEKDGITPRERFPRCILPNFRKGMIMLSFKMFLRGIMLNAVGLSGPKAETLFEMGLWQKMTDSFFLSFMAVGPTPEDRIVETEQFVNLFAKYLPGFKAKVGLQINGSCPNVGLDSNCEVDQAKAQLKIASSLGIPLMWKFNVLTPPKTAKEIANDPNCDAVCISNTIPWGKLPDKIPWKEIFGSETSPLAEFGGGGMSGPPLLPLVKTWVRRVRFAGVTKPINAGGGIFSRHDLRPLKVAGATSVFRGSVSTLRPLRVRGIIKEAHKLF